jgi:hypothetical protein
VGKVELEVPLSPGDRPPALRKMLSIPRRRIGRRWGLRHEPFGMNLFDIEIAGDMRITGVPTVTFRPRRFFVAPNTIRALASAADSIMTLHART